jgi:outer membrane protein OmpA-like peptidoglycan-associated protein
VPSQPAASAAEALARIMFPEGQDDLSGEATGALDSLAQELTQNQDRRIQLLAYAAGDSSQVNQARRLSLSRALSVRQYLIDKGIRSTRMDVRALGNNVPDGPPNRVDIVPAPR